MILLAACDLHDPGRDYEAVEETLKSATSWSHPQASLWLLDTLDSVGTWRDRLQAVGDANDHTFVTRLHVRDWAGYSLEDEVITWLNDSARRW